MKIVEKSLSIAHQTSKKKSVGIQAPQLFSWKMSVWLIVFALAGTLPACSGCRGKEPLAYVPEDSAVVVVMPSLEKSVDGIKKFIDHFREIGPVSIGISRAKAMLNHEIGFDPEDVESIKKKGFDPSQGIAFSLANDGESMSVVLGVSDKDALDKYLREMANKAMRGNADFSEKNVNGQSVTLLALKGAQAPKVGWVFVKKQLIIGLHAKDNKVGEYVTKLTSLDKTIKDNKQFSDHKEKMGEHLVMVYFNGATIKKLAPEKSAQRIKEASSDWLKEVYKKRRQKEEKFLSYFDGATFGLAVSEKGIAVRGYYLFPSEKGKEILELIKGEGEGPDFSEYIGPDALAVGRFSLNPKRLFQKLKKIASPKDKEDMKRDIEKFESETHLNVEKDILNLLSGRFAIAVYPPNTKELGGGGFSIRNPMSLLKIIRAVAMAQLGNTQKAVDIFSALEGLLQKAGIPVKAKTQGEQKIYSYGPEGGETMVSWAVSKKKGVLLLGTSQNIEATLKLIDKGGDNVLDQIEDSTAKKLLKAEDSIVFHYNLAKTVDMVRGLDLPGELKLMLSSVTSLLGKLTDFMLAIEPDSEGLFFEMALHMKK